MIQRMKRPKITLLAYLLLNILISAGVTLAILRWHDHRLAQALPCPTEEAGQPPAAADITPFEIVAVVGAGQMETEYVMLHYLGESPVDMAGWTLSDEDGHVYTFPALTLFPDGMTEIHTAAGDDSAVALHWGLDDAVWQSGELVTLADPQGVAQALYRIP